MVSEKTKEVSEVRLFIAGKSLKGAALCSWETTADGSSPGSLPPTWKTGD